MRKSLLAAIACAACAAASAAPFDEFKGKMKPGMYEVTMEMEMPGMPAGMGKHKINNCVSAEDIESGKVAKGNDKPDRCEIKDFKMSGNTATYTTVCKGDPEMTADTRISFLDSGYKMDMKMTMNQGGQVMKATQRMEGRLVGPCKK